MCVRTKTSYGCGHVFKSTNDCYSSACPGIDRYHYLKEGDCRDCKSGGTTVSRGREGQGRYAKKAKKPEPKESSKTASKEEASTENDVSGGASPWAQDAKPEKTWQSPHRQQADVAWVSEHKDRISDLQDRLDKVNISDRPRPSYSKELVLASDKYDYDEYDQDDYEVVQDTPSKSKPSTNVRQRVERAQSHRHQDRQHSHDSLPDSMPSYRSSPKLRKPSSRTLVNPYPDASHDYDYYNNSPPTHTPIKQNHHHKRHHHVPSRSRSDNYYPQRSQGFGSDYEIAPIPPIQMPPPAPAGYETYEYYSPNANPSGAPYTFSNYPYDVGANHPSMSRPQHYVGYQPRF